MTQTSRPDGRAFTTWSLESEPGDRLATKTELAYVQERLADLHCPFCLGVGVTLKRTTCVCHRTAQVLSCDASGCRAAAYLPVETWDRARGPAHMARLLRRLWKSTACRVLRVWPADLVDGEGA